MKVLVIQPKIGMGDMIIYLPYIHAISKKYGVSVSILVKENSRAKELLAEDNHIEEIILLDRNKEYLGSHDGIKGFFNLTKEIKVKNFDRVFIFNSSIRYFLIAKLAGIKDICQYPFFTQKDNIVYSAKILTENKLNTIVSSEPKLILTENKIEEGKKKKLDTYKHICLGFSASGATKRWDVENYINLCKKLNQNFPCKFYLAGGTQDQNLINLILKSEIGPQCLSFSNLKIKETIPIIKNCDVYIGNDTGWLHISVALGLKCLALFMDSPVMAYGKYSKNIFVIVPEGETEKTTKHNTLGKNRISFDKVYEKALKLLN